MQATPGKGEKIGRRILQFLRKGYRRWELKEGGLGREGDNKKEESPQKSEGKMRNGKKRLVRRHDERGDDTGTPSWRVRKGNSKLARE